MNVSNKTFFIKDTPTFPTTDMSTHKTFTAGGVTYDQLTIYHDGEIWYGNDTVAYANGEWEIEYRYLTFGANQQMDDSDYAKFLQVYEVFAENPKKLYFRIGQNGEYKLGSVNNKIKGVWGGTPFDNTPEPSGETWVINESPHYVASLPYELFFNVNFSTNLENYTSFTPTNYIPDTQRVIIYGDDVVAYVFDTWTDQAYRTVTFETAPTGDLLTWLQANAVKQ